MYFVLLLFITGFVFLKFVTEKSIEEKRKLRQEEWERVRKPEDPKEVPEEVFDGRSLYDRLKEQKDKKVEILINIAMILLFYFSKQDAEWDEAHKLKNMVRGLDSEEADFLEFVDKGNIIVGPI